MSCFYFSARHVIGAVAPMKKKPVAVLAGCRKQQQADPAKRKNIFEILFLKPIFKTKSTMKKITKILLLSFILICANMIDAYCSATITFKIARHRDCKGFGWCKWEIVIIDDGGPAVNKGTAIVDVNEEGHLVLTINKEKDLSPEAFETYFSKGIFICEDDFPVPFEILKELKYPDSYTIKEGVYPVTLKGDNISIEF